MLPKVLAVALLLAVTGCATQFASTRQEIEFGGPGLGGLDAAGVGASVWFNGKPLRVRSIYGDPASIKVLDKPSDKGFGTMIAYRNVDPYRMGPGNSWVQLRKSLFTSDANLILRKAGYRPVKLQLERSIHPAYWFNVLNLIGFIVDFSTGAMWEYGPAQLQPRFIRVNGGPE